MRIAVFTDPHLGLRQYGSFQREQDFYDVFETMIDDIIKQDVDLVINGGDIFDKPTPSAKAIYVFKNCMEKLNKPVLSVIGNHTVTKRKNFLAPDYLFDNIVFLQDNPYLDEENSVAIVGCNYQTSAEHIQLAKKIKELGENIQDYKTKILVLHQALELDFPLAYELADNEIDYDLFDIIIVGHLHNRIARKLNGETKDCLIIYPGSVTRCSIAEARDEQKNGKGYMIIDINEDMDINFHNIDMPRQFIELTINSEKDLEQLQDNGSENKPLLFINGSGDVSLVNKIYDKIETISNDYLHIKVNFNTNFEDEEYEVTDKIMDARTLLRSHVEDKYDKTVADLSIDLLDTLGRGSKDDVVQAQDIVDTFFNSFRKQMEEKRQNRSWDELTPVEQDTEISLKIDFSTWDRPFFDKTGRLIYSFVQTYSPFERCYVELVDPFQPYRIISVDEYWKIMRF